MLFRHDQSKAIWLLHNRSFKILVSERNYKNNLKNRESQQNNIFYNSRIYVYGMFCYEIPWFYQDFKSEKSVFFESALSSRIDNTGSITKDHVKSSKIGTKRLYNSKSFSFMPEQVYFYLLEAKFIHVFKF